MFTTFSFVDMDSVGPEMSYSPNSTNKEAKSLNKLMFILYLY